MLKAESISDLISAETEIQRLQALRVMQGSFSKTFNILREELLKILSFVEAKIDFPDEDLPDRELNEIKKVSGSVLLNIEKILNDQKVGEIIREGFKIAHDISSYSFTALAKASKPMLNGGSALLTLTYLGAIQTIPNYNVMGLVHKGIQFLIYYSKEY